MSFIPRFDILPSSQKKLWPELAPVQKRGFVLYGGTAVALRLGHRQSIDFDFFSSESFLKKDLLGLLPFLNQAQVIQDSPNTLSALVKKGEEEVKVSFFGTIDFGRIGKPDLTPDKVAQVASIDDLMSLKLATLLQRVEAKDYIDIAAMLNSGISLEKGLAGARALYGKAFQPNESLKALTYFEGGDLATLSNDIKNTLIKSAAHVQTLPTLPVLQKKLCL